MEQEETGETEDQNLRRGGIGVRIRVLIMPKAALHQARIARQPGSFASGRLWHAVDGLIRKHRRPRGSRQGYQQPASTSQEPMAMSAVGGRISPPSGRKWKAGFTEEGLSGRGGRSRRPVSSPDGLGEEEDSRLLRLKERHGACGGRKRTEAALKLSWRLAAPPPLCPNPAPGATRPRW